MKKMYNPFKMIGSYLGSYLIITFFSFFGFIEGTYIQNIYLESAIRSLLWIIYEPQLQAISLIFLLVIGFIIGWIIHSIIRKYN